MRRMLVVFAALGLGIGGLASGGATAGTLVPGGWLAPIHIPPAPPAPPVARRAVERPAPRLVHPRVRVRERRPPMPPRPRPAPLPDGKVRF